MQVRSLEAPQMPWHRFNNYYRAEMRSGSEEGSYSRPALRHGIPALRHGSLYSLFQAALYLPYNTCCRIFVQIKSVLPFMLSEMSTAKIGFSSTDANTQFYHQGCAQIIQHVLYVSTIHSW